ncbi:hypothetical protein ACFX1Q_004870 [Malus domestica]
MTVEDSGLDGQRAMAPILRERWGRAWGRGEDSPGGRYGFREKSWKGSTGTLAVRILCKKAKEIPMGESNVQILLYLDFPLEFSKSIGSLAVNLTLVLGKKRFLIRPIESSWQYNVKSFKYESDSFGKMQMVCDWEVLRVKEFSSVNEDLKKIVAIMPIFSLKTLSTELPESMIEALHDESDIDLGYCPQILFRPNNKVSRATDFLSTGSPLLSANVLLTYLN